MVSRFLGEYSPMKCDQKVFHFSLRPSNIKNTGNLIKFVEK